MHRNKRTVTIAPSALFARTFGGRFGRCLFNDRAFGARALCSRFLRSFSVQLSRLRRSLCVILHRRQRRRLVVNCYVADVTAAMTSALHPSLAIL